jgi:coenzyme PQQ precursor peptide PqqA
VPDNDDRPYLLSRAADITRRQRYRQGSAEAVVSDRKNIQLYHFPEKTIMWTKPEFTEMRFGFEVTMYIANR